MSRYWREYFEHMQQAADELLPKWRGEHPGVSDQELLEMNWNKPEHLTKTREVSTRKEKAL
jgi:hypothetical protein